MRSAARGSPFDRPTSASTIPTSVSSGKLWPLATSWVPMITSYSPRAAASSCARSRSIPPGKSDDSTSVRASGNSAAASSARRSTPGPQAASVSASRHCGQISGRGSAVAAMVADERLAEPVLDQPGGAVRALEAMAAGAAKGQRRVAAPVEEQQRLFAGGKARRDRLDQPRRQPAAARRAFAAKVDRGKVGHRPLAETRWQLQPVVAAALGVDARLQRRRRRGEHHRRAFQPAAHHRHVARVVDDAVLLLVGALVLFVDDDQAEIGEGQEQSRARADDDARFAARHGAPQPLALAGRDRRVPLGRPRAEAGGETVEELRRQRDLRQQHQRLPPGAQGRGDRLEIDFGLARAGDAFEQDRARRPRSNRLLKRLRGGALVGRKRQGGAFGVERRRGGIGVERDELERAVVDEAVDDADAASRRRGERGAGLRRLDGQRRHHALARRRQARGRLGGRLNRKFRRRRRGGLGAARRHAQRHAARGERPARDPIDEVAHRGLERRPVAPGGDRFEIAAVALANRPDDAGRGARP